MAKGGREGERDERDIKCMYVSCADTTTVNILSYCEKATKPSVHQQMELIYP